MLKGGEFHVCLTVQAQNAVLRSLACEQAHSESCYFNMPKPIRIERTLQSTITTSSGTTDTHASAFLLTLKVRIHRSLLQVFHAGN